MTHSASPGFRFRAWGLGTSCNKHTVCMCHALSIPDGGIKDYTHSHQFPLLSLTLPSLPSCQSAKTDTDTHSQIHTHTTTHTHTHTHSLSHSHPHQFSALSVRGDRPRLSRDLPDLLQRQRAVRGQVLDTAPPPLSQPYHTPHLIVSSFSCSSAVVFCSCL